MENGAGTTDAICLPISWKKTAERLENTMPIPASVKLRGRPLGEQDNATTNRFASITSRESIRQTIEARKNINTLPNIGDSTILSTRSKFRFESSLTMDMRFTVMF